MPEKHEKKVIKTIFTTVLIVISLSSGHYFLVDKPWERVEAPLNESEGPPAKLIDLYEGNLEVDTVSWQRRYPHTIKLVSAENQGEFEELLLKRGELAVLKANTIKVNPYYELDGGRFVLKGEKGFWENAIKILKEEGFAVWLSLSFGDSINNNLEQVLNLVGEWGKTAEELKVEYFQPVDLDYQILKSDKYQDLVLGDLPSRLAQAARGLYTGKIAVLLNFNGIGSLDDYSTDSFDLAVVDFRWDLEGDTLDVLDFELKEIYGKYFPMIQEERSLKIVHRLNLNDDYRRAEILRNNLKGHGSKLGGIETNYLNLPYEAKVEVIETLALEISTEDREFLKEYVQKYDFEVSGITEAIQVVEPKAENVLTGDIIINGKFITSQDQVDLYVSLEDRDGVIISEPTKLGNFGGGSDWVSYDARYSIPEYNDSRLGYLKVYLGNLAQESIPTHTVPIFFY